jgi:hypothetical protein
MKAKIFTFVMLVCFIRVSFSLGAVLEVPSLEYPTIQSAIDAASDGDEIIVAEGRYFENINFKGKNITLRSIEPNNPDVVEATIIDGSGTLVTFVGSESEECVLSGLTIVNGGPGVSGNGSRAAVSNCVISGNCRGSEGGGLYDCDGKISNCTVSGNSASGAGGGLYGCDGEISNCAIIGNSTCHPHGGGLSTCNGTIRNCIISGNAAEYWGGGLHNCGGTVINCSITGNAALMGGGMGNSTAMVVNCNFSGNWARAYGGGICGSFENRQIVVNCTFSGNRAEKGGSGIYHNGSGGQLVLTNSIIWRNPAPYGGPPIELEDGSSATVSYSNVQYGWPGEGNINQDPLFVHSHSGVFDFGRFVSVDFGCWVQDMPDFIVEMPDYHLQSASPCIDAGSNAVLPADIADLDGDGNNDEPIPFDLGDNARVTNGTVDMGAYEFFPVIHVAIDIKPGSEDGEDNTISLGTQGLIPVAIFTEVDVEGQIVFDARTVNPDTVELAGMGVSIQGKSNDLMAYEQDVNEDGFDDLVVHVATANFDPGSVQEGEAVLTGTTYVGLYIMGKDEITIVPPEE